MESILRKLDLTSLRLFVAVCQENSIARAAERDGLTYDALIAQIVELASARYAR